jgi:lipopolysaccharide heptosyltransferase II
MPIEGGIMIDERWQKVKKVLAVRLDNLGDVLVTTPALHAIKTSLPYAELTLLASPVGAQVARLNPDIDDVIVYDAPWMDPWHKRPQDSQREQQMIATIRERHFDGAIIFTSYHQSPLPAAYLCYLADIPLRVAASIDGPGSLLTTRHKHPERMMHEVERGLDLVGAIGLTTDDLDLVLQVPAEAQSQLAQRLTAEGIDSRRPLVVVHPGCSMPARTYPWEMYAQVVKLLVEQLRVMVALTGTKDEEALVERVLEQLPPHTRKATFAFAGKLSFPEFCALIEAADLTITNNTGPMHISAALKTPVVALFALTNPPEQWGPWHVAHRQLYHDVSCRICYCRICPYGHECLRLVSPQMVVSVAGELIVESTEVGVVWEEAETLGPLTCEDITHVSLTSTGHKDLLVSSSPRDSSSSSCPLHPHFLKFDDQGIISTSDPKLFSLNTEDPRVYGSLHVEAEQ